MTAAQKPAVERFAEWMLALALRFWPADSKEWGKAMAAELSNVRSSKEVVRWTIGGMQCFSCAPLVHAFLNGPSFLSARMQHEARD
ncbi:MAG: hypothetical protein WAK20_13450 [Candidatus Acidiferrum sp.]